MRLLRLWLLCMLASALGGAAAAAEKLDTFALLLPGPADDHSWNEVAFAALKKLESEGFKVALAENVAPPDAPRLLREFADRGFKLIVAHSFGFQDAVMEVAEEYPETYFAWAGGIQGTAPNVADYDQPHYQASYLIGIIAGHISKSKKFGALYGFDVPVCHAMGEALLAGAKTVVPAAQLLTAATGDWNDVAKAKEAALAQSDAGVDYWIECGEGQTYGAIAVARERGGYATGYVGDMSEQGPGEVLVSLVWDLEPLFRQMIADVENDRFDGPYYSLGIKENSLRVAVNPALADKIPPAALKAMEEAQAKIKSGELEVPYVPQ